MGHDKCHLRHLGATIAGLLLFLAIGMPVAAHARLTASSPISGSALVAAPATVDLAFSESIEADTLGVNLTLPDGSIQPLATASGSGESATATIDPAWANDRGIWIVRWSVLSATDGHWSDGTIAFSVGTGLAPTVIEGNQDHRSWGQIVQRAFWLLLLATIVTAALAGYRRRPVLALIAFGCVLSPLVASWGEGSGRSPLLQLLAGALGAIAATVLLAKTGRLLPVFLVASGLVAIALSGHATGANRPILTSTAAIVHLLLAIGWLATVAWIGCADDFADIRRRIGISPAVLVGGVFLLAGAGILMAFLQVPDQASLRATTYGVTLLVKTGIVLAAIGFGVTNWLVVRRWIGSDELPNGVLRQARWVLRGEALFLALAVSMGAALAETAPPARTAVTTVASPLRLVDQHQSGGDLIVDLKGALAGTADDVLTVALATQSGADVADVERVIVRTVSGSDEQRFDADAVDGHTWSFSTLRLPYSGTWTIEVTVRRTGQLDVVVPFTLDTTSWVAEAPRLSNRSWQPLSVPVTAMAFVVLALIVLGGGFVAVRRNGQLQPAIGAVIIIALVAIATGFVIQGEQRTSIRTPDHDLAIPAGAKTTEAGTTYARFCLACHGVDGQGIDATNPNHLHSSGTDLLDADSRRLSDGDLFWLITNGVAGTAMPAYDVALTEEERWDLVRYIRATQEAVQLPV